MLSTDNGTLSNPGRNSKRTPKMSPNQSLNHLLNFTLPPRQPHANVPRRSNRKMNENSTYGVRSTERFVNAQYRFIMKPSGDYTVHFADPDIFFHWEDVLQVIIPRNPTTATTGSYVNDGTLTTCPICLSPPVAPRMTKCGHVFCFSCILHYLNVSDVEKWIRCPICFDSVNENHLKSVKWFDGHLSTRGEGDQGPPEYEMGSSPSPSTSGRFLRMRLMQRPQITTLALPRSQTWPSDLIPPHQAPFHFLPDVFSFSKFMLATPEWLIVDLTRDLDDLMAERTILASMDDHLSLIFVEAAEIKVRSQIQKAEAMNTESLQRTIDKAQRELADIKGRAQAGSVKNSEAMQLQEDIPEEMLSLNAAGTQTSAPGGATRTARSRRNVNPPPPSTSTYYYYQSAAGNPVFLHPIDIRILLSHFKSYSAFPDQITIKVEAASEGSVNEDLRKRCKYLALPEGADVVFVEADLEPVVGAEGLKNFEGALKTRRAKRKEKNRKDDRARLRAEEKEREKMYDVLRVEGHHTTTHPEWPSSADEAEPEAPSDLPAQQPQPTGAWGSRSFASALHASPPAHPQPRSRKRSDEIQDEWDVDVAWHEMQQRGGGRKKGRKPRMVVLGGGSGAARLR